MGYLIEAFFAGLFLTNALPHFFHGISGDRFPTPFARPPGKGLSPAFVNAAWGLFNLGVAWLLWHLGEPRMVSGGRTAFAAGVLVMGLWLPKIFEGRMRA